MYFRIELNSTSFRSHRSKDSSCQNGLPVRNSRRLASRAVTPLRDFMSLRGSILGVSSTLCHLPPKQIASRGRRRAKIKWDTVSLNFSRKSLKTKKSDTHKVGHFFERPGIANLQIGVLFLAFFASFDSRITRHRVTHHAKQVHA
jgi:hypothetical protein